jgi:hypothetical protein
VRGDPTPVCLACGDFLPEGRRIQIPDGRLICFACYAPTKQSDGPTWIEVDDAIQSIRRAAQ